MADMMAVVTTGNGGFDKLEYKLVPRPEPGPGEVRLKVLAAGVNNTEINTRLGWYAADVTGATEDTGGQARADGGWNKATPFPLIQGTDCCGQIEAIGDGVAPSRIGERVIVRACMRPKGFGDPDNIWMASDFDGAFADYVVVPADEAFAVDCDWSDAELASIPCAYGTSENMLHRADLKAGETVLVSGASGGVGSATVQLAKRRGARVIAMTSPSKAEAMTVLGADTIIGRDDPLEAESIDLVVDNVAGAGFSRMLKALKRRGRLVSSGAIAGPMVDLDMRDMYLKDLTLIGTTGWDEPIFPNLVRYIEGGEIRPLVAATYPLSEIVATQKAFMEKAHVGKFVLIPGA